MPFPILGKPGALRRWRARRAGTVTERTNSHRLSARQGRGSRHRRRRRRGVEQDVGVAAGLVEPTDLTCSSEQLVADVADEREGGVAIAAVTVGVDRIERDQVADRRVNSEPMVSELSPGMEPISVIEPQT